MGIIEKLKNCGGCARRRAKLKNAVRRIRGRQVPKVRGEKGEADGVTRPFGNVNRKPGRGDE